MARPSLSPTANFALHFHGSRVTFVTNGNYQENKVSSFQFLEELLF